MLSKSPSNFEISSYAQETICYLGQQLVFEEASEMLRVMRGTEINSKQIERICHYYGGILEDEVQDKIEKGEPKEYGLKEREQTYYVMTDGAMFLTREKSWKEAKMARIFKSEDNIGKIVFVGDGARWIWNWVDDFYSGSIQILDYYHAAEHLHEFANIYFKDENQRGIWVNKQKERLIKDKVDLVIKTIQKLCKSSNVKTEKKRNGLIKYYQTNRKRMKYKTFLEKGLLIGSGAIESAHRHVLQQRLKLSGQRWTKAGLQQIANLRVAYKSNE